MEKPTAFIIEDDAALSRLYADALQMMGFQTHAIRDGQAAIQHLDEQPAPNIIILDINLPHVSGHYLLRRIRSDASLQAVPLIIATANSIIANAIASELGDNDYLLIKPFDISMLQRLAQRLLQTPPSHDNT